MSSNFRWSMSAATVLLVTLLTISPGHAADAEIAALKAEIVRLSERLDALEQRRSESPAPAAVAHKKKAKKKAAGGISVKGDFRYRYEMIDQDGSAERHRNRIRARVGLAGRVNDSVTAGVQLATGGDSPTTTNQTLDDGFSTKDFGLDLAFVTWAASDSAKITAGKMKNPMHRVGGGGLVWDGDLNPEGLALAFSNGSLFVNAAGLYVEERPSSSDSFMLGGQAGINTRLNNASVKAGVGYYAYTNTRGNSPFYDGRPNGNSVDIDGNLVNDYKLLELFAELRTELGDMPFSVFADWVQNTEVDLFDSAYAFGVKLGKAGAPGSWDVSWIYQDVESDAVLGAFSDSDFGGGGTDVKGHIFNARYSVAKNWIAGMTYYLNEFDENVGAKKDYKRLQADLQFKF